MKIENLKLLLDFEVDTGKFIWKISTSRRIKVGDIAGWIDKNGYIVIGINGKTYYAHRLAWFYMTGEWPKNEVDHRNRIRNDNRWCNLRESTSAEQRQNQTIHKNNTSGYPGVYWNKQKQKWIARIGFQGKGHHIGVFDTPEEAYEAYLAAKKKYHPFQPKPR